MRRAEPFTPREDFNRILKKVNQRFSCVMICDYKLIYIYETRERRYLYKAVCEKLTQ